MTETEKRILDVTWAIYDFEVVDADIPQGSFKEKTFLELCKSLRQLDEQLKNPQLIGPKYSWVDQVLRDMDPNHLSGQFHTYESWDAPAKSSPISDIMKAREEAKKYSVPF